jgi:hypothetical protein
MAKLITVSGDVTDITIPKEGQLAFLQEKVGGYIEIAPYLGKDGFAGVVCNEEGKLVGMEINHLATGEAGYLNDCLVGDVILFNHGEID